jgi:pilus assembly protein CpaF
MAWAKLVHTELMRKLDLGRVHLDEMGHDELRTFLDDLIQKSIQDLEKGVPENINKTRLKKIVLDETVDLGAIEDLLADPDVTEVMVNCHDDIYVEKKGKLIKTDVQYSSPDAVLSTIERIISPLGRRIDESSPMVDARLRDGSRVNAIIPPLALRGPCLTIRKFSAKKLQSSDLIGFGAVSEAMVEVMSNSVIWKRNIIVSGGTGSGKTTLLNVLSNYIPVAERVVTVEDAAELQLVQPHVVSLEARPANMEGRGAVSIRELVKNCLRMRPDRIVVGECRGGEALDMLQAMNTGHDGSLTTAHANTPRDMLRRLEVMVLMSGMDLPIMAIREQISSAVHMIVQQTRFPDGSRRVTSVTEVTGIEGETIALSEIFRFDQEGFDDDGRVKGSFKATGQIPVFYEELRERGINLNLEIFKQ